VRRLQARREARHEAGVFVLEGTRIAEEALAAGATARLVLYTPDPEPRAAAIVQGFSERDAEVLAVTPRVLEACSGHAAPPGLLLVVDRPQPPIPTALSLALVADGLADPGNLGSLIRTCVAAGVEAMFLTPGTVDPYNPKVVRGGMGAHFRLPIEMLADGPASPSLSGLEVWLAAAGDGTVYHQVDWRKPTALVVGGEARGGAPAWRARASGVARIPMRPGIDSLNAAVAAGVLLFEIARQRGSP
jgi:TrmH family RNA methyltransferase